MPTTYEILSMKRLFSFLAITVLAISCLTACNSRTQETPAATNRLRIVTTIFPQYDFAREIAGGKADITMLLKPGMESHSYEPSPRDIQSIQNSDLFIYTGGENDAWVENILNSMGEKKPATIKLLDTVKTVEEETANGMEHGHDGHRHDIDEHVWTSPKNAIAIVDRIAAAMSEKDPDNATLYEQNRQRYVGQLQQMNATFRDVIGHAKRKTLLFGDRFPFRYFADEYGLKYYAAFTGCSVETEASAATLAFLIDRAKKEHIPVVFTIEFSNGKIADAISDATGARKMTLYSYHNLTRDQLVAGETVLGLMQKNIDSLKTALY